MTHTMTSYYGMMTSYLTLSDDSATEVVYPDDEDDDEEEEDDRHAAISECTHY